MSVERFSVWDYVILALMLLISASIGVYFRCTGGKQKTASEFLMANRQMSIAPVAMSLLATFMSAITLLGTPAEIYIFGTQYMVLGFAYCLMMPAVICIFHPVFYRLQITSVFEYLEMRFHKSMRTCGAVVYIIQMNLYLAIVLYAPSLALNAVTGLNIWLSVCSVGIVCTFYTTMGGMKAVMWTDLFQCIMMLAGLLAAVIKGCMQHEGGLAGVWQDNQLGGRIEFLNFGADPTIRHSWWSLLVGGFFTWTSIYCNQAQVQRTLTTRTLRDARIALILNLPGLIALMVMGSVAGLVVYARYSDCDPIFSGKIFSADQLFPLLVMDTMAGIPGLPGLFVSCIFSGAMSTMSSGLNSLAAITVEDIVCVYVYPDLNDKRRSLAAKILAFCFGFLCLLLTLVAAQLGQVLQAALGLFGVISGPLLGLFSLGMLFPRANWKGAWAGVVTSLVFVLTIFLGAQITKPVHIKPPRSMAGCEANLTSVAVADLLSSPAPSVPGLPEETDASYVIADTTPILSTALPAVVLERSRDLFSISYLHYATLAVLIVIVVGYIVSWATGFEDARNVDARLLCPWWECLCCCLPARWRRKLAGTQRYHVKQPVDDEAGAGAGEEAGEVELKAQLGDQDE